MLLFRTIKVQLSELITLYHLHFYGTKMPSAGSHGGRMRRMAEWKRPIKNIYLKFLPKMYLII